MQDWLKQYNIECPQLNKKELYVLIKQYKPRLHKYKIDEMANKFGHEIVRLPPYHCDLNQEELIWAQIQYFVAERNKTFKMKEIQKLFDEALEKVSAKDW